jgi:hypothetical protein
MTHEHEPQMRTIAAPPRRTLEDKLLKFIEGHNPQIWTAIAVLAAVVVLGRWLVTFGRIVAVPAVIRRRGASWPERYQARPACRRRRS